MEFLKSHWRIVLVVGLVILMLFAIFPVVVIDRHHGVHRHQDWQNFAAWSTWFYAVIASFTFLAIVATALFALQQLAMLSAQMRHQTAQNLMKTSHELLLMGIDNPQLLQLFRVLPTQEAAQGEMLDRYARMWLSFAHSIWYSHHRGFLEDDLWEGFKPTILGLFTFPPIMLLWEQNPAVFGKEFQDFIEAQNK